MEKRSSKELLNVFRRKANVLKLLFQTFESCRRSIIMSALREEWYSLLQHDFHNNGTHLTVRSSPFIAYIPSDDSRKEINEVAFDKYIFSRQYYIETLYTEEIQNIIRMNPADRSPSQETDILRFLEKISKDFNTYPLDTQRQLVKSLFYEKHPPNRILCYKGLMADFVFFLLSGELGEKTDEMATLRKVKIGQRFGEEDIVCGWPRRSTIITLSTVELLGIHRFDYRDICNAVKDAKNPDIIDVCRHDLVLKHYPLNILKENPGTWTVLSYRNHQLIVKDSNASEWIYVIKSGEAYVVMNLTQRVSDMKKRLENAENNVQGQEAIVNQRRKVIDFINGDVLKADSVGVVKKHKQMAHSAPAIKRVQPTAARLMKGESRSALPRLDRRSRRVSVVLREILTSTSYQKLPEKNESMKAAVEPKQDELIISQYLQSASAKEIDRAPSRTSNSSARRQSAVSIDSQLLSRSCSRLSERSENNTPEPRPTISVDVAPLVNDLTPKKIVKDEPVKDQAAETMSLFVRLETVRKGHVLGLKSCLEDEDRGPSVSLVSGGCEVLQISKKFFLKNASDTLLEMIRLHVKTFPRSEEVLQRVGANVQWEKFRARMAHEIYHH